MWFGVGDGSAHATTTGAVEMKKISNLRCTLSLLENDYCSVENNVRILPGEILNQEDRKVERVVPNALSWVRCHRLGDKPIHLQIFLRSCFPAFLISAALLPERRGDFRAGWRLEFERGRRNRRARLVRIRGDDAVAVRQ